MSPTRLDPSASRGVGVSGGSSCSQVRWLSSLVNEDKDQEVRKRRPGSQRRHRQSLTPLSTAHVLPQEVDGMLTVRDRAFPCAVVPQSLNARAALGQAHEL